MQQNSEGNKVVKLRQSPLRFDQMADKNQQEDRLEIDPSSGDDLNAKIGVLTRPEVEARILAPLIQGFNPKIILKRTQTIMQGAAYCDFRYTFKKGS